MTWWMIGALALGAPDAAPVDDRAEPVAEDDPSPAEGEGIEQGPVGPDRSGPPEVLPAPVLELPEPTVVDLGGGVQVWHVRVPAVRKVAVYAIQHHGTVELAGTWNFQNRAMGWMMDVAAGDYGAAELSELEDLHELDLWSSLSLHEGSVKLIAPKDELAVGLELQQLVLHAPSFPKRDLKRYLTDQELFFTTTGPSSQRNVANSAVAYAWFPADHPYGTRPDLAGLDGIKPKHLAALHRDWLASGPAQILVVGDLEWAEVEAPVRALAQGLAAPGDPPPPLDVPRPRSRVIGVHMPGQEQVAIRMRLAAPPVGGDDRVAMEATNWVYGGHFLSRLNTNLREDKGFTYGAYSRYRNGLTWGSATLSVDVAADNTAATVTEILAELDAILEGGVTPEELDGARRGLTSEWNQTLQTADSAVSRYQRAIEERRSIADLRGDVLGLGEVDPEATKKAAATWWGPDQPRVWVFVGDRAMVEPQLVEVGMEAEWLTPSDAILGNF